MTHSVDEAQLGQFIPVHYHHNMLLDKARMQGFRQALALLVKPGAKVVELGGGTGVLSYFAARNASKVWCVERNPVLAQTARQMLAANKVSDIVQVVLADAFNYLRPQPVDVVICEMLHVGLLREKQIEIIRSFKQRYVEKFGLPLPLFVPEACLQAVQPIQQDFVYEGYYAATPVFQNPLAIDERTVTLADPALYQSFTYDRELTMTCEFQGEVVVTSAGTLNALRFITKNILAFYPDGSGTVDWHNAYLVVPLTSVQKVEVNDMIRIQFSYRAGAPLDALVPAVQVITGANSQQPGSLARIAG